MSIAMIAILAMATFALGKGTAIGAIDFTPNGVYAGGAFGEYSLAAGRFAEAHGTDSFAFGDGARAEDHGSMVFGSGEASAGGMALGSMAKADGTGTVAVGWYSEAENTALALGAFASATGDYSTAIGYNAKAQHEHAVVINAEGQANYCESSADNQITTCGEVNMQDLPESTDGDAPDGSGAAGALCISNEGNLYIDADGVC